MDMTLDTMKPNLSSLNYFLSGILSITAMQEELTKSTAKAFLQSTRAQSRISLPQEGTGSKKQANGNASGGVA